MDGRFVNKAGGDSNTNDYQNKRNTMTLNVNGLWDVVPRLDHYRLVKNQLLRVNKKRKRKHFKGRYHLSDFYRYLHYRPIFLGLFVYCIYFFEPENFFCK